MICRFMNYRSVISDLKVSSQSRKFEFNVLASNIYKVAISFDVLDRFQENKVFQTAQKLNNILREVKYKMLALSPWTPRPFQLEVKKIPVWL